MKAKLFSYGFLLLLCLVTGCTSFHHEWRKAGRNLDSPQPLGGQWEGQWVSLNNGHSGKLKCVLGVSPDGKHFRAHFRATYAKYFHFSYVAELTGVETGGNMKFTGESDLGKLAGGIYKYSGQANATNFACTYESKYDHGTFQMSRSK